MTMTKPDTHRIAYFITPHGYGHASRAAGVMEAMYELDPALRFEIFTKVPPWFFEDSLSGDFEYHSLLTDIGLVQKTPLLADVHETLRRLNLFLPLDRSIIRDLAETVTEKKCQLIICDIAPMGIAVAREAGIPSVLVENFTWDWIYQEYVNHNRQLIKHIHYLKALFDAADFHIQSEPICCRQTADLTTCPISRKIRTSALEIRKKLGIPKNAKVVMITMGGIPEQYPFLEQLTDHRDIYFIIPGTGRRTRIHENLVLLPHQSGYFHPDLVNASDAVIGKVGYSTLAEIYYAGKPFGYIARSGFRESQKLVSFIKNYINDLQITEKEFYNGAWLPRLPLLLALPQIQRHGPNGAAQVAHFVYGSMNPAMKKAPNLF